MGVKTFTNGKVSLRHEEVQILTHRVLKCIICSKSFEPALMGHDEYQPYGGIMCSSYGNYGSTVWDVMLTSEYLQFNICDSCIVQKAKQGYVLKTQVSTTNHYSHSPWNPDEEI